MNNSQSANNTQNSNVNEAEVEVLYQRMGDRWFAFSVVGDDVFVGSISPDELNIENTEVFSSNYTGSA